MPLSNCEMSMRPLCSNMFFKHVYYIIMTCLTKFLSWLVGVQSSPCSSNCICILTMSLSSSPENVIYLWEVTWALALKKWKKYRCHRHKSKDESPQMHAYPWHRSIWRLLDTCLSISREH